MEIDYIESLRKQKEDAWEAFDKARNEYNEAMCKKYKEKFVEIAIDEYQDSNLVQVYVCHKYLEFY